MHWAMAAPQYNFYLTLFADCPCHCIYFSSWWSRSWLKLQHFGQICLFAKWKKCFWKVKKKKVFDQGTDKWQSWRRRYLKFEIVFCLLLIHFKLLRKLKLCFSQITKELVEIFFGDGIFKKHFPKLGKRNYAKLLNLTKFVKYFPKQIDDVIILSFAIRESTSTVSYVCGGHY